MGEVSIVRDGVSIPDVIVIGGGIMGCSAAYHMAKAGARVTILERNAVASEASGRNCGNVRVQLRHPLEIPIILEAIQRWRQLDEELGMPTEFRTTGNILLTFHEEELEGLEGEVERLRGEGVEVRLVSGQDLREIVPGISETVVAGMYSAPDGHANPQLATLAYAQAARRVGVNILTGAGVNSILVESGRVRGVDTSQGEMTAGMVLNAAGVGSPALGRSLGLDIPVTPWRYQVFITERTSPITTPFVRCTGPRLSWKQAVNGSVLVSMEPAEQVGLDSSVTAARMSRPMRALTREVPALGSLRIVRGWAGWFEMTPDDLPILGAVEGIDGLFLATGFSGHGFAIAPAIGATVAELMVEGQTSLPIHGFRPSRFQEPGYGKEKSGGKLSHLWTLSAEGTD